MKEYEFEIKEILEKRIKIKAKNLEDARDKLQYRYDNCDIVLSADDFSYCDIKLVKTERRE